MNRKLLFSGLFLLGGLFMNAQEVEIKDEKVLFDGKQVLKYEKTNSFIHTLFTLDDNELLLYKFNNNETREYLDDDYLVLNFIPFKKKVETTNKSQAISGMGLNSRKNMQKLITWLLKEKVINANGAINPERLDIFYEKYNENITERTVR